MDYINLLHRRVSAADNYQRLVPKDQSGAVAYSTCWDPSVPETTSAFARSHEAQPFERPRGEIDLGDCLREDLDAEPLWLLPELVDDVDEIEDKLIKSWEGKKKIKGFWRRKAYLFILTNRPSWRREIRIEDPIMVDGLKRRLSDASVTVVFGLIKRRAKHVVKTLGGYWQSLVMAEKDYSRLNETMCFVYRCHMSIREEVEGTRCERTVFYNNTRAGPHYARNMTLSYLNCYNSLRF